jgi:hypothetical protein
MVGSGKNGEVSKLIINSVGYEGSTVDYEQVTEDAEVLKLIKVKNY